MYRKLIYCLLLIACPAWAATYYVSPTGSDSNNGLSTSTPWQTINHVNAQTFSPGDQILFQAGGTFSTGAPLTFTTGSQGTQANHIVISSYNNPSFPSGTRANIGAGNGIGIQLYEVDGYTINNINVVGSGASTNTAECILVFMDLASTTLSDGVTISNVNASGCGVSGITVGSFALGSGFNGVTISNVIANNNGDNGIQMYNQPSSTNAYFSHTNVLIQNSTACNNAGRAGAGNSGSGINISGVNGAIVQYNLACNNGANNTNSSGPVGIWAYDSNNVTIQYNESYGNSTNSSADGDGFDLDQAVTNSIMQYNYGHGNAGACMYVVGNSGVAANSGNVVRYNVCQNDGRKNGFGELAVTGAASGTVTGVEIYNNTVYSASLSTSVTAAQINGTTSNVHFRNNLFLVSAGSGGTPFLVGVAAGQTAPLFQNNDYWTYGAPTNYEWAGTTYTSFAAWQTATGQEEISMVNVGLTVDPHINGPGTAGNATGAPWTIPQYRLMTNSTMGAAGQNLLTTFGIYPGTVDFFGYAIPDPPNYSVGASQTFPSQLYRAHNAVIQKTVCASGCDYADPDTAEGALSTICASTWPVMCGDVNFQWTAGQSFTTQLVLQAPNNGQAPFTCVETSGSANLSCRAYYDPVSGVTMCAGMPVSGAGFGPGVVVSTVGGSSACPPSVSGSSPYTVALSSAPTPPAPLCTFNGSSIVCTQTVGLLFGSANWVTHESSQQCAQPGYRAGPVNTSTGTGVYTGMAKLMNALNNQTTVTVATTGVSYHRFGCLEISSNPSLVEPYNILSLFYQGPGSPGSSENQTSQLVHHIVFNQDYLHHHLDSNAANTLSTVLYPDPGYMEVTNSTIMVFHPDTESHDFGSPTALGPLYMRNNEFESSQIATITGGNASGISGMKSTGGQWIGNYYYRPWLWRVSSSTVDPGNTFFPSTCMYDSVGGESFINSTSGHWWLCVSGTWTDQGVGTPSVPYCQVSGTCDTTQASTHVCTSTASSTALTCLDTTGISNGQFITAAPFVGTGAFVSTVNNMTSITTTQPANWGAEMSMTFSTPGNPDGGVPFCNNGCSIDKNQFELKNAFGNIAEGNWIQNGWQPTMLGQTGECVLMNQIDGPVGEVWAGEMYTTFKNNRCDSTSGGWVNAASGTTYNWINRGLNITNNLFTNIGLQQLTGTNTGSPTNSTFQLNLGNWLDESVDHNTTLLNNSVAGFLGFGSEYCGSSLPPSTVVGFMSWTNSIFNAGQGVWSASCGPANGFNPFALSFTWPTSHFMDDIVVTTQSPCQPNGSGGNCGEYQFSNNPCNGCQYPTSLSSVFQSYPTNLAVSSTYQGTAYLGTDPGADIQVVNWSTQGNSGCPGSTPCGAPNPYLDFRVRALLVQPTSAAYTYTAPDTGTCTLTVANNSAYTSPVYSATDSGGNPDRSVTVTGLSAGTRYWYELVCGTSSYYRKDTFTTP